MSIIAYIGLSGHGKSYDIVASVILPALRKGRIVYHNLTLFETECMARSKGAGMLVQIPEGATAEEVVQNHPPGAVVVLDEVYQYWPAGTVVSRLPKNQLEYFAKHRHSLDWQGRSTNVYIVDQELSTTAKFICNRVDKTAIHTKLDDLGAAKRYRVDIYNRSVPLDSPPEKKFVRSLYGRYDPAIFSCYKSHTLDSRGEGVTEGDVLEEKAEKRATIWGDWRIRGAIASVLALPVVVGMAMAQFKSLGTPEQTDQVQAEVVEARSGERSDSTTPADRPTSIQTVPTTAVIASSTDRPTTEPNVVPSLDLEALDQGPKLSKLWRVGGVLTTSSGGGFAHLVSATGSKRMNASECETDGAGNWRCPVIDGTATMWSGSRLAGDGTFLPMTSAAAAPGSLQRTSVRP